MDSGMDVEVHVEVEVYVEVAEWLIPWAATLTPVLAMLPINSIFTDEVDALDAPQKQECIPDYTQNTPPWLADMLSDGVREG